MEVLVALGRKGRVFQGAKGGRQAIGREDNEFLFLGSVLWNEECYNGTFLFARLAVFWGGGLVMEKHLFIDYLLSLDSICRARRHSGCGPGLRID